MSAICLMDFSLFQSTPPRRGDGNYTSQGYGGSGFNPRPREGATHDSTSGGTVLGSFNPRPREGATDPPFRPLPGSMFQSTPPRRGDLSHRTRPQASRGFNPRPREGATRRSRALPTAEKVSIHAPAKGRRSPLWWRVTSLRFQSTPPRRGDYAASGAGGGCGRGFNPRPREGATEPARFAPFRAAVSIHAPAKGRRGRWQSVGQPVLFQSTPPRRGDRATRSQAATNILSFQSTPPRRGDYVNWSLDQLDQTFQSTPPRRGDHGPPRFAWARGKFQSTPPRRGDTPGILYLWLMQQFQSTPPRRGDFATRCLSATWSTGFNPRPREGATQGLANRRRGYDVSIHAPAKGRLSDQRSAISDQQRVSIHAPAKGRPRF